MKKITYTLITLLLSFQFAHAQFWEEIEVPDTVAVHSVVVDNTLTIFIGSNKGVYRTVDNGDTWSNSTTYDGYSLYIDSSQHIYTGGSPNGIYYSVNNGDTWEHSNYTGSNNCVFVSSEDNVFIGFLGGISKSDKTFENWTEVLSFSNTEVINDFAETSNAWLYAVNWPFMTPTESGVYRSTDGGDNWEFIDIADDGFTSVAVNSKDTIFAASYYEGLYKSSDYGDTWTQILVNTVNDIFIDSNDVIYVASDWTGVHRSFDNGETWEDFKSGLGDCAHNFAIAPNGHLYCRGGYSLFRTIEPVAVKTVNRISKLNIFPNPVSIICNIEIKPPLQLSTINIYNIYGQLIDNIKVNKNLINYPVNHLPNGIYFIEFSNQEQKITKKIIVKH